VARSARGTLSAPAAVALCALAVAGCGGGDGDGESSGEGGTTTAAEPGGERRVGGGEGGVSLEKVGDFDQPVFVAQPPGAEDLYVVEKPGRIRLVRDGQVAADPVLDISDSVSDEGEQGFLSIAFAPDFASSRLLYAYYTDSRGDQRVVEYRLPGDGTRIDPASEREVLLMDDFASNHNGGLLLFGPDDLLYIGTGDGGVADDPERTAQDLGSLLGKILRIDPRERAGRPYSVPRDNPFAGAQGARPEVYAYGLRNPWRYSFDRDTGALSVGDVGQNSLEEVDFVAAGEGAGANFGWSAFEGDERFNEDQSAAGHVPPVLTYGRDAGCSVTGGYVVRDASLKSLYGRYLYGDFCNPELRSFVPGRGRAGDDKAVGLEIGSLSSFAEDRNGRIYATSLDGPVFRLVP
jgi:glucose/arabinose dehydrogenase